MCIDGMTIVDRAVYLLIPTQSQWPEFYSWAQDAFALTDDSWDPAGVGDPSNGNLPYGKMINAIYLLAYALRDEYIPQWHARADYLAAARAAANAYHGPFYARFADGGGEATANMGRTAARDRTDFHCALFNQGGPSDDPANRASVLVHEAWHHWQYKYGWQTSHLTGGAIKPGLQGDWYYRHGSGAFDFGTLWRYDLSSNPIRFHSPYQVGVEYDADLAEFSYAWIPTSVAQSARAFGNTRLAQQFKNRTSYRIGQPRPF